MPNWCQNLIEFDFTEATPEIKETLKKVSADYAGSDSFQFFASFFPCPEELRVDHKFGPESEAMIENKKKHGFCSWYDWSIANWGTKWDAKDRDLTFTEDKICGNFATAWGPPIGFYEFMEDNGVKVFAKYAESGFDFAGFYENGQAHDTDRLSDPDVLAKYLENFPSMREFLATTDFPPKMLI
jgi:hypothetical protein